MEYLVGGYTMLNDFDLPGGKQLRDVLGGSVFSAAGIRLWRDSVAYIGAAGEDFDLTFGLMHTAEKSAEILVKTLSMRPDKLQTIQPDEFRHLAEDFHVTLPEEFLYEK